MTQYSIGIVAELQAAVRKIKELEDRAAAREQLTRDLLARLSQDYGDAEDCDDEVAGLFERGEMYFPVQAGAE